MRYLLPGVIGQLMFAAALSAATTSEAEKVGDWRLSGDLEFPDTNIAKSEGKLFWRIVRLGIDAASNRELSLIGKLKQDGKSFIIEPNHRILGKHADLDLNADIVIAMYKDGAMASTDPISVKGSPLHVENLKMKFSSGGRNVLRVRVLDPVSSAPVPNVTLSLFLAHDDFVSAGFADMKIGDVTTDAKGTLELSNVPEGHIGITGTDSPIRVATPDGAWLEEYVRFSTLSKTESDRLNDDQLPVVYYIPEGWGMFWNRVFNGQEILKDGTSLHFHAKNSPFGSKAWDPKKEFDVTVGKDGLIKTPIVPEGIYDVKADGGSNFSTELFVAGVGSIHIVNNKPKEVRK